MFYKVIRVAEHQRVLWFRDGNLMGVLAPGKYTFWKRTRHLKFESYDVADGEARLPNAQYLIRTHGELLAQHLEIHEIDQHQVALIRVNKLVTRLALPGEVVAFWKQSVETAIELADFSEDMVVPQRWVNAINRSKESVSLAAMVKSILSVTVEQGFESLLVVDGVIERTLMPGRFTFWKLGREVKALSVDKRVQEIEINGQEILTRDRVSLRTNASLQYRIVETMRAVVDTPDVAGLAYRAVQFALRRAIGSLTLDELLADKTKLGEDIQAAVSSELSKAGIAVTMVGIKDIILPGEMKTILNQVVEAEKVAEANTIRRRDETQSVRALANTARQLEGNAMMARLKELEALETVSSSVNTLNVYNGLEGVMGQLVNLKE